MCVCRTSGLGIEEWAALRESLKSCVCLVEVLGFGWCKSLLAHGIKSVDLDMRAIGDLEAVIISALLPRTALTLTGLHLG